MIKNLLKSYNHPFKLNYLLKLNFYTFTMEQRFDYPYPKTTKKDESTWVEGNIYMYKNHPFPVKYAIGNKQRLTMICTECNKSVQDNPCSCSQQQKLMHEDRMMHRTAILGNDTPMNIAKFVEKKGCTPQEFRDYLNSDKYKYRYGKGKEDSLQCDHIVSPMGNNRNFNDFDLTNKQHRDFIFHYKNIRLIPSKDNQHKNSSNHTDEIIFIYEEFYKNTSPNDIHDMLISRRKYKGNVFLEELQKIKSKVSIILKNIQTLLEADKQTLVEENKIAEIKFAEMVKEMDRRHAKINEIDKLLQNINTRCYI